LRQTHSQVDVFAAVYELWIEPPHALEQAPANRERVVHQHAHFAMLTRWDRPQVETMRHDEDGTPDDGSPPAVGVGLTMSGEPTGLGNLVVVQEHEQLVAGGANGPVACR